jgi:hypothetical protein
MGELDLTLLPLSANLTQAPGTPRGSIELEIEQGDFRIEKIDFAPRHDR